MWSGARASVETGAGPDPGPAAPIGLICCIQRRKSEDPVSPPAYQVSRLDGIVLARSKFVAREGGVEILVRGMRCDYGLWITPTMTSERLV